LLEFREKERKTPLDKKKRKKEKKLTGGVSELRIKVQY
jgi:hypothetical protein